ncbi:SMP-30/gluconolactonase/LRE family protein [Lichenicola sp.]|uniref:SMP-30/gluconolactonase/LRE family protein n=1 Tax=Lichenicola sp. TaxID=2804529 RepID=UPI003B0024AD
MSEWRPSPRYPDPAVQALDPAFGRLVLFNASVERLSTGGRWHEGPVWFGDMRALFWSDIPNDRIMRWDEETGAVTVFRRPSGFANGNTRDRMGRLVSCEHGGRRVTRTEHDGRITTLADRFESRRLNSPNDVVVHSDGSVWFTDPPFGILGHYEGNQAQTEIPEQVYRLDANGTLAVVADDVSGPNGLCFSPDERILYLVESRTKPRRILAYDVSEAGTLGNKRVLIGCDDGGAADGIRCDIEGNIWAGWGTGEGLDGVMVFAPDGTRIGRIVLPERCANLCFGGRNRNRLFMAASTSVYSLYVATQGAV